MLSLHLTTNVGFTTVYITIHPSFLLILMNWVMITFSLHCAALCLSTVCLLVYSTLGMSVFCLGDCCFWFSGARMFSVTTHFLYLVHMGTFVVVRDCLLSYDLLTLSLNVIFVWGMPTVFAI